MISPREIKGLLRKSLLRCSGGGNFGQGRTLENGVQNDGVRKGWELFTFQKLAPEPLTSIPFLLYHIFVHPERHISGEAGLLRSSVCVSITEAFFYFRFHFYVLYFYIID